MTGHLGHSWNTSEALRAAISVTMAAVSQAVAGFGTEALALEEKVKATNAKLRKFDADRQTVDAFGGQVKSLEVRVRGFRDKLSQLTANLDIAPASLDDHELNEQLTHLAHRLALAKSLVHLRQILDSGHSLDEEENWSRIPIDQLLSELERILGETTAEITDRLVQMRGEKTKILIDLEKWRPSKAEELAKLESAHRILSEKLPILEGLEEAWRNLCGESVRSDVALEDIKKDVQKHDEAFSTAESHLQAAKRVLDVIARGTKVSELKTEIEMLEQRINRIESKKAQAIEAAKLYREKANRYCAEQLDRLFEVAFPMFSRVQANEVFDSIHRGSIENPFDWIAESLNHTLRPSPHFSMGQRQDLALAIFIARARGLSGTFFLDEPIIHLDDLNRVALLDMFRMLAVENGSHSNFVITTASRSLVRHMAEKFANVSSVHDVLPLRIYELDGNPRVGVKIAHNMPIGKL